MPGFILDTLMENTEWLNWDNGPLFAEKKFWETHKEDPKCIMFPWKTFLKGKLMDNIALKKLLLRATLYHKSQNRDVTKYYTFCEERNYKPLLPLLKELGIHILCVMNKEKAGQIEEGIEMKYNLPFTLNEISALSNKFSKKN